MRPVGKVACLVALVSCGEGGSASSWSGAGGGPVPRVRITADATVGDAAADPYAMVGPDGGAPVRCDAQSSCPVLPPSCVNTQTGVEYGYAACSSDGLCYWTTTPFTCTGGICIGGPDDPDAALPPDAGPGRRSGPCFYPAPPGPPPPAAACEPDAGDGGAPCPPPPSQCIAGGSGWFVYYDDGACVSGQCVWQTKYAFCGDVTPGGSCVNGACRASITSTAQ